MDSPSPCGVETAAGDDGRAGPSRSQGLVMLARTRSWPRGPSEFDSGAPPRFGTCPAAEARARAGSREIFSAGPTCRCPARRLWMLPAVVFRLPRHGDRTTTGGDSASAGNGQPSVDWWARVAARPSRCLDERDPATVDGMGVTDVRPLPMIRPPPPKANRWMSPSPETRR